VKSPNEQEPAPVAIRLAPVTERTRGAAPPCNAWGLGIVADTAIQAGMVRLRPCRKVQRCGASLPSFSHRRRPQHRGGTTPGPQVTPGSTAHPAACQRQFVGGGQRTYAASLVGSMVLSVVGSMVLSVVGSMVLSVVGSLVGSGVASLVGSVVASPALSATVKGT